MDFLNLHFTNYTYSRGLKSNDTGGGMESPIAGG